jgi:FkbH-like protein
MYKQEEARQLASRQGQSDFLGFLRACDIVLTVNDLSPANMTRVFELTERTNQLNYVARKMSRLELEALERWEGGLRGLVLSVVDRYGDYGIVGFALVDMASWSVESFFMSCRVQRKKVDHAFFDLLRRHAARAGRSRYAIAYRPSKRNEPSRVVLEDEMRLPWHAGEDNMRYFDVDTASAIVEADIVRVEDRSSLTASALESI